MNRFAHLLDRLAYEPGRNNKLRLITSYFREVPDPDRGWALAALTGALSFRHAKAGLIRDLIAARTDPALFALSYAGLGISMYPYIVPQSITIWQAAAPENSQIFMLVGVAVLIPLILAYTAWAYYVFRGKVQAGSGYH